MKQHRNTNGRYARRPDWFTFYGIIFVALCVISTLAFDKFRKEEPKTIPQEKSEPIIIESKRDPEEMKILVKELQDDLLHQLAECETGGLPEDQRDGYQRYDPSSKETAKEEVSNGRYQWKVKSVMHVTNRLGGQELTNSQALMLAIQEDTARDLTRSAVFNHSLIDWWYNCNKKHDLDMQVKYINKVRELSGIVIE